MSDSDIISWAESKQDQFGIFTPAKYRFAQNHVAELRREYTASRGSGVYDMATSFQFNSFGTTHH